MEMTMNDAPQFSYDLFMNLEGLDLVHYMEPFLAMPGPVLTADTVIRMRNEFARYDEFHLVYVIELAGRYAPAMFKGILLRCLTDDRGSVWSAAYRVLGELPDEEITAEFVSSLQKMCAQNPNKTWIADMLADVERRVPRVDL